MGFEVSGIGYNDSENGKNITGEIVDMNDNLEHQLVHEINEATKEFRASIGELCDDCLENLNNLQLAHFLSATYFPGNKAKSYRECISGDTTTLEFSIRAALQLLEKRDSDDNKYNANGIIVTDGTGKTIDERLMGDNMDQGIKADKKIDETIVKILQTKVGGVVVDGKPGPQTISRVIGELGGNTEDLYKAVNNYYSKAGGEKFRVKEVITFPDRNNSEYDSIISKIGKSYKFDSNKLTFTLGVDKNPIIIPKDGTAIPVTVGENKTLTADGYTFTEDGWIIPNRVVVESDDGSANNPTEENEGGGISISDKINTICNSNDAWKEQANNYKWISLKNQNGEPTIFAIGDKKIRYDFNEYANTSAGWYATEGDITARYFYKKVKDVMDVGNFEDIFNITYANFKEVKENNGDTPDYQKVGESILNINNLNWRESNDKDLGKWVYSNSLYAGGGFLKWCENMKGKDNVNVDDLTIGNWIAISDCSNMSGYDANSIQFHKINIQS